MSRFLGNRIGPAVDNGAAAVSGVYYLEDQIGFNENNVWGLQADPPFDGWKLLLNQPGSGSDKTGTITTLGSTQLLVFGVGAGGGGGASGDDDGGGGGGGGAGQFTGYLLNINPQTTTYIYAVGEGGAGGSGQGGDGANGGVTRIQSVLGGTISTIFELDYGDGAVSNNSNQDGNYFGAGGANNAFASHPGGTGHLIRGRSADNRAGRGVDGNYGGAGGGGGGAWLGQDGYDGTRGRNNNLSNGSKSSHLGESFDTTLTYSANNGGSGGQSPQNGQNGRNGDNNLPAYGGTGSQYCGAGGAGGGMRFFNTGLYGYGAGGGGAGGQGGSGGKGGDGYLIIYGRQN
jgi:hypothetical protein